MVLELKFNEGIGLELKRRNLPQLCTRLGLYTEHPNVGLPMSRLTISFKF